MILPPGTHCSRLSRNGSHMSTHTASIPFRWRLVNSVRKYSSSVSFLRSFPNHNGSAVSRWHTTVRNLSRFPWYSSSTPCVATAASAGWPRNAPSTVDRCPVPCSVPDPSAAPPAAPRRSHRTAPPRPQTVCCRATCWATAAPSPPSLRTPGNPPDTVPPPPWFDTQSTADPGSLVHSPRASCAPVRSEEHTSELQSL